MRCSIIYEVRSLQEAICPKYRFINSIINIKKLMLLKLKVLRMFRFIWQKSIKMSVFRYILALVIQIRQKMRAQTIMM